MANYKDFVREIKGYVDVTYDIVKEASTFVEFGYFFDEGFKMAKINKADNTQELSETYTTTRVLNDYATLCENYTLLDGSFMLFNKLSNNRGFYSDSTISDYRNIHSYASFDGFYFLIGNDKNLITADTHGITIYFKSNNVIGNNIRATLSKNNHEEVYSATEIINHGDSLFITFDESIKDGIITIDNLFFEYEDRRIIISHIDLGLSHVYKDKELIEFTVIEEVDKLVEETPTNELDMTVGDYSKLYDPLNPKGIAKYLTEKATYIPYIGIVNETGNVDYTKMGEFYYNSINYQDKQVTITAYNLMNELANVMIKNTNGSLIDTSSIIFTGHLKERLETFLSNCYSYDFDISINNERKLLVGFLQYSNLISFLQLATICNGILYIDRDNKIIIKPIDKTIKDKLSKSELSSDLKYINVENTKSFYIVLGGFNSIESTNEQNNNNNFTTTFTLQKEEEEICVTSSNPEDLWDISDSDLNYSGATSVHVLGYSEKSSSLYLDHNNFYYMLFLKVKGVVGTEVTISAKRKYKCKSTSRTKTNILIGDNENTNKTIDNPMWYLNYGFSKEKFQNFIDEMYSYKVNIEYNGNPLIKAGDYIEAESNFGYIPLFITKHKLKFDGGLSGSIEGVE